jgi:hypothetical protein
VAAACAAVVAGCGSSAARQTKLASSVSQPGAPMQVRPVGSGSPPKSGPAFLREVNVVCETVRQNAPRPLASPYTPVELTRYTTRVQAPTQRTIVSLRRLAATGDAPALTAISTGYTQLQAAYTAADLMARTDRGARQLGATIQQRELAVSAVSRASGVPACGVAGR